MCCTTHCRFSLPITHLFQLVPWTRWLHDWNSISCDSKAFTPWRIKCLHPQCVCVCPQCWPATVWPAKRLKSSTIASNSQSPVFLSDVVCPIKANNGIPWLATVFTAGLSECKAHSDTLVGGQSRESVSNAGWVGAQGKRGVSRTVPTVSQLH